MNILKKIIFTICSGALFTFSVLVTCVAGCKTDKNQHLDGKGNSVWAFLPKLNDQKSKFDSADVWRAVLPFIYGAGDDKITNPSFWSPEQRGKISLQLLKILSVSLLSNCDKIKPTQTVSNWADYDLLVTRMKKAWTDLKTNTNNYIAQEKQKYKNDYGKKWEQKWHDMLKDKYDGSEKKYKADLLATGKEDNASLELTNILLNRNQKSYVTSSRQTIKNNFARFKNSGKKWSDWAGKNASLARLIVLSATEYRDAKTGVVNKLWKEDETQRLTLAEVKAWKGSAQFATRYSVSNRSYNKATGQYESRQLSQGSYSGGLISEFQKFIISKWFQWTKPLAISSVTFEYNDSIPGGRKGLYNGLFADKTQEHLAVQELFKTDVVDQIEKLLNQLTTNSWTSLSTQQLVKPTYDEKLMTIAGGGKKDLTAETAADYQQTAVYSNMSQLTQAQDPESFQQAKTDQKYLTGLLTNGGLARRTKQQMAGVFAIGDSQGGVRDRVLVYFDTKGLNLVHIDGLWAVLQQNQGHGQAKFNYQDKIAQKINRPQVYDRFENYIQPQIKSGVNDTAIISDGNWSFNSAMGNFYQQYLINRSYVNRYGSGPALTKFNVMDSINSFAVFDNDSTFGNHLWYSWIYDFYNYYFQRLVKPSVTNWFDDFIQLDQDHKWFDQALRNHDAELSLKPVTDFATTITNLNKSIRDADAEPGIYPKGQFFDDSKVLDAILSILRANSTEGSWFWYNGGLNEK